MSINQAPPAAGLGDHRTAFVSVPVVDIGPFLHGDADARAAVALEVACACEQVGFLYIGGHGISSELEERASAAARAFYALPEAEKRQVEMDRQPNHRGWVRQMSGGDGGADGLLRWESFKVGFETPADDPDFLAGVRFYGPNAWPARPPEFRVAIGDWYAAMLDLSRAMFRLFAAALELPEDTFTRWTRRPASIMNVNYYPGALTRGEDREPSGLVSHSDYECFAILWQDGNGGLELMNAAGEWIAAPPVPGTFVINIGDIMARWTNDRFASTRHRVVHRGERDRLSIAFFGNCDYHTKVACLPTCHGPDNPPRYPPTTVGEHLLASVRNAYSNVKAYGGD